MDEFQFSAEELLMQLPSDLLMAVYEHLERSRLALASDGQADSIDTFAAYAARMACEAVLGYIPELDRQAGAGRITLDVYDVSNKLFLTTSLATGRHNDEPFEVVASLGDASPIVQIGGKRYMVLTQDIVGAILSVMCGSPKSVGDE